MSVCLSIRSSIHLKAKPSNSLKSIIPSTFNLHFKTFMLFSLLDIWRNFTWRLNFFKLIKSRPRYSCEHWRQLKPRHRSWRTHLLMLTQWLGQVTWSLFIVNIIDSTVISVVSNNFPLIPVIYQTIFWKFSQITIKNYPRDFNARFSLFEYNSPRIMYFVCQTWCVFTFLKYFLHAFPSCKYLDCACINLGCKIVCL